jgi:hypothetical protein
MKNQIVRTLVQTTFLAVIATMSGVGSAHGQSPVCPQYPQCSRWKGLHLLRPASDFVCAAAPPAAIIRLRSHNRNVTAQLLHVYDFPRPPTLSSHPGEAMSRLASPFI